MSRKLISFDWAIKRLLRSQANFGILEGFLSELLFEDITIEAIPQDSKINNGDLVLTSGLGGNYPPDMLIGQVSGVRQRPVELFQTASVEPVVDFSQLEIVLVIVNFRPINIAPLIPTTEAP